jgi:hypothetical protein
MFPATTERSWAFIQPLRGFSWKRVALLTTWSACILESYWEVGGLTLSAQKALFVFYQPVFHMLCMLWLWSAIIWFFEERSVRYEACFASEHLKYLLPAKAIAQIAAAFTTFTGISAAAFIFCSARGKTNLAAYQPALMFLGISMLLLNPLDISMEESHGPQRWFFLTTVRRVFLPFQVCTQCSLAEKPGSTHKLGENSTLQARELSFSLSWTRPCFRIGMHEFGYCVGLLFSKCLL